MAKKIVKGKTSKSKAAGKAVPKKAKGAVSAGRKLQPAKKKKAVLKKVASKKKKAPVMAVHKSLQASKPREAAAAIAEGMPARKKGKRAKKAAPPPKKPGIGEKKWVGLVCVIFLSVVIYSNTLQHQFVYDDAAFIQENNSIRSLDNPGRFFTQLDTFSTKGDFYIYRPIPTLSLAIDYSLWGLDPKPFHVMNIIFHVLSAIIVYFLMLALVKHPLAALLATLVFAAHPVNTESVAWVSGRSNLIFFIFYILSFLFYLKVRLCKGAKRALYLFVSLGFYALGLFSKEMAITLPFILALYDLYFTESRRFKTLFLNIKYYLLYWLVAGGYLYQRYDVLGRVSGQEYIGGSFGTAFLTMSKGIYHYIKILLYPLKLSAVYVLEVSNSLSEPSVMLALSVIGALLVIVILSFKNYREVSFSIMWFFITILPVSNIIPLQDVAIAERFLYLPSIGYCIIIGMAASLMFGLKNMETKKKTGVLFVILLVIFFSLKTMDRNKDWKDDLSFWTATKETAPDSYRVHNALGFLYDMQGDTDRAIASYELSLRYNPDNLRAHNNLAIAYAKKGWYEKAIKKFRKVLESDPYDSSTHGNLGLAYFKTGLYNDSIRESRKAIELNPVNSEAYNNLGLAYEGRKLYSRALNYFSKAFEIDPGNNRARQNHRRVFRILSERKLGD